jgi:hypothetical protein
LVQHDAILGLPSATPSEQLITNNNTAEADILEVAATFAPHEYVNSVDALSFCRMSNNSTPVRRFSFVFSFMAVKNESLEPGMWNLERRWLNIPMYYV